jgi:outer membrane protein
MQNNASPRRAHAGHALLIAATAAALPSLPTLAADEPLWEAGMGVAALHFPDYRGSIEKRNFALPAPYFVYRGDFFRADRHGMRGALFDSERVNLNLSMGASLPVHSEDNAARAGMPNLKPSIELGPAMDLTLWRAASQKAKVDVRLPLRFAMTIESNPRYIGMQAFPHLNLDVRDPAGLTGWNLGMLAGPVFTDRRHNSYFYSVAPQDATPTRPAYEAGGGYAGSQFIVALSKRFPSYWIGAFVRFDSLRNAAFEDSALVTSRRYAAGGIAISWIFAESKERVTVNAMGDKAR